jgi:hypothetical protein
VACSNRLDKLIQLAHPKYLKRVSDDDTLSNHVFNARLIPLNKVHPKDPRVDDYRPIVVLSHSVKFLEWTCIDELRTLMASTAFSPSQHGFRPGKSIYSAKDSLRNLVTNNVT